MLPLAGLMVIIEKVSTIFVLPFFSSHPLFSEQPCTAGPRDILFLNCLLSVVVVVVVVLLLPCVGGFVWLIERYGKLI